MAKQRMINCKFWEDDYIATLTTEEKLLFLYLITNPQTNICGIYETTYRKIAYDTGLPANTIVKAIHRLSEDKKAYFIDGWIYVVNFVKNQSLNPKIVKGIEYAKQGIPVNIRGKIDSLCIGYDSLGDNLDSNSNLNSDLNINKEKNTNLIYISLPIFPNLKITQEEFDKLSELLGDKLNHWLESLDLYIQSTGKKYKSHYATILVWTRKEKKQSPEVKGPEVVR